MTDTWILTDVGIDDLRLINLDYPETKIFIRTDPNGGYPISELVLSTETIDGVEEVVLAESTDETKLELKMRKLAEGLGAIDIS